MILCRFSTTTIFDVAITPEQMTKPNQSPELLGTLPNNPADKEEALKYYEGQISDQPIENALVFTADGEVYHATGDENTLNPILDLGDKLNGATVTHNHPVDSANEGTFSDDDIDLFTDYGLAILHGIDENYIYELSQDVNNSDFKEEITFEDIEKMIEESEMDDSRHLGIAIEAQSRKIGYRRWKRE